MKRYLIIFFVLPLICSSQPTDITTIHPELTGRPWLDNSMHQIYGYKVTMVFGERNAPQRHSNLGSITNMAYIDPDSLVNKINSYKLPDSQKEKLLQDAQQSEGGAVELFITRPTESRANFRWFFIVIRGEDDKEKIMEIDLEYQASQLPEANGWWNHTLVFLPLKPEIPFYVYLNDRQSVHLSDFKYHIDRQE
jgi:hypothetical protein